MTMSTWVRFGALPDATDEAGYLVSRNHRDGGTEDGVSVYEGHMDEAGTLWLDLTNVDALSARYIIDPSDCWLVTAPRCAEYVDHYGRPFRDRGADGEPLVLVTYAERDRVARKITPARVMVKLTAAAEWIAL